METNLNASNFVKNTSIKITRKLFINVLEYVIFCYFKLINDSVTYSKKNVKANTSHNLEDYLKIRMVEDYLQKLKIQFNKDTVLKINFQYETQKEYTENGKIYIDKIDIFICNVGLQDYWGTEEENIYFAIECKRLQNTAKSPLYVEDIKKFTNREYNFRIPISGMIGFVEKSSLNINDIVNDINNKLRDNQYITTLDELTVFKIDNNFHFSFRSKHNRKPKGTIELFHLLFDYSNILTD